MKYKVIDVTTNKCISSEDNTSIILKPDGRVAYNDYGDEIGIPNCVVLFYPREDNTDFYIDEIGGIKVGNTTSDYPQDLLFFKLEHFWMH